MIVSRVMSSVDRTDESSYRKHLACISDEDLFKEIWVIEEHIKYLHREDDQSVAQMYVMLNMAMGEKERRAYNKGYM